MPLITLSHVNVRTANLPALIAFYRDVLGMRAGPRPAFSFGGAWMYLGDHPFVHLVEVAEPPTPGANLQLEHFAFAAHDLPAFTAHLHALGVEHRVGGALDSGLRQVHLHDPEGNHVHVDFVG
jgi:catechol 2,3-dioxygenase-like lactoylglutathione lyase family enzyme